jgi:putative addiction module component (TIGR02574 family)
MSELSREELLAKAMQLSSQERGWLIDELCASLHDGSADPGAEEAWAGEIERRVEEVRAGRVKLIPGEQVLRELAEDFPDGK